MSNNQLENLLRDIEYAEDYKNSYDYDPLLNGQQLPDYYDVQPDDYKVEPVEPNYTTEDDYQQQFIPIPEQHSESLSHGSKFKKKGKLP